MGPQHTEEDINSRCPNFIQEVCFSPRFYPTPRPALGRPDIYMPNVSPHPTRPELGNTFSLQRNLPFRWIGVSASQVCRRDCSAHREILGASSRAGGWRSDSVSMQTALGGGRKFLGLLASKVSSSKPTSFLPADFIISIFWRVGILNDPNDTESILIITFPLRAQSCLWKNF